MADVNIFGVVAIIVFYLLILVTGLWAARRRKKGEEEAMLAGRSIGIFVGTFTMTGNRSSDKLQNTGPLIYILLNHNSAYCVPLRS